MSRPLLERIEEFRKQKNLPILTLCKMMDVHNVTYHRWRNAGKITGAYHKIVEDFLEKNHPSASVRSSDIAVIGLSCYYPGASNAHELWENILARRVQFRRMLDQRLPLSEYYSEDQKTPDKTYLTKAAFLENFNFDWGRLRIPKKTVESTDIAHWLALDIALKTFEDAGFKLSEIPLQNTGVIVGNTLTGEQTRSQTLRLRWPYVQKVLNATLGHQGKSAEERGQTAFEMEKIFKSAFYPVTEDSLAGGLANTIAGRICNYLNLKGGGYIVDGACSSSLLAVATAADALKMGNMDLALAGGVDISLDPFELVGFAKAGALARDQMRVYDQKANGFLPGEGCGFVLLKRLKDALRDKNYVYAVIKGWGISSDGKGGIMEPSSSGQSFAIGRAYKDLDYKISDVNFVEGHGTGTTKGDRVELEGIAAAIDKTIKKADRNKRGCGVTSFKSIVGHTKAAAGVGGLIKAVMAVNQRVLPPTATCIQPNDVFKDKAKNLYPIMQGERLSAETTARAGISSAGFGGINCHVTVESKDKPRKELKPRTDERALFVSQQQTEVFVFTSRTIIHLKKLILKFKEDLRNISIAEMADLAALLNQKVKNSRPVKVVIVSDSPEHLYDALVLLEQEIGTSSMEEGKVYRIKTKDTATRIILSIAVKKSRVGFLFPGQGSQRLNMTRALVERYGWARDLFKLSRLPLFEKIYSATDRFLTREEQQEFEKPLSDTRITQPSVVLSSLIWSEFFSRLGIEPQLTVGHSLGELTAFYKAGAFNKETLIKFAQLRGELMAATGNLAGSMVSLFCSKDKAAALIEKIPGNIVIANINHPNQTVVSGGKKEIEKITALAQKENIAAYPLKVSNAFHSSFMKEASEKILKNKILPAVFNSKGIKVYSCMSAGAVSGKVNLREYFSKQVVSPVDFVATIRSAAKECDLLIELGPGKVLTDLVRVISKEIICLPVESTVGNDRDLNMVLAELFVYNVPVKWDELYKNRLIRTFVPASRKTFIENQCEHPLKIDKQVIKSKFLPVLLQANEEESREEEIIPGGLPELGGKNKASDLLIAFTQEITGFDRESISLNLRLLDDLNLDSIKAAELIGKTARALGITGQVDPSQLSNNTLGQISDRLSELVIASKTGSVKETVSDILKRYHDKSWVRNFVLDLRPEEIKTKNVNQLKALKNIVLLSGKNEEGLAQKIKSGFKIPKSKASKASRIDCLIAVFPKSASDTELNKLSLRSEIEQLHQVTELANSKRLDKDSFVVFVQFGGGTTSIASTLFLERPDLKVRIIDFDKQTADDKIPQRIMDELQTYEPFSTVRYDSHMARHAVYYVNSNPADYKDRGISWSGQDVVLVTGGAKGITAQCALEFARVTKVQMALMGRSPAGDTEITQTLKQFKNENLKCAYYQCDVTSEKEVFATIEEIEKKSGPVTGFIHGAGLNSLKRLKQASIQEAYQEALPKVIGAVNVCNALKNHPPKLIAGITSIIGVTGMEGSGWYGFSNETLDLYLGKCFPAKDTRVVTIAYSIWDEVGMGAKLGSVGRLAEKGIGAIPVKEGISHFRQLIEGDPGTRQVIVAARVAGIATWKSPESRANNSRFLEKIEYILPGVELIAQANLNVESDPYLLDHNWKGSLLFPFVFGFEAMAQAVAYVCGIEKFEFIKARHIDLQRPISVPQDSGTTIEIHAIVQDGQVKVEIYSQETGYKEPHFSAVFEISSADQPAKGGSGLKPKKAIDLDIQNDIYGPILFQGKLFQCIEQIHELYYDEGTKEGECVFTSAYSKTGGKFLTGDPYFIDSILQSMQLIIPQDISLPRDIEEIELIPLSAQGPQRYASHSNIKRTDVDHYRGDAETLHDGFLLRIKNCRLKILDTLLSNPSANDLVDPARHYQNIIENKLAELSKEFGLIPPVIRYAYDERLKNASKDLRHKIELPHITSALEELLKKDGKSSKDLKINWLKTGKPVVEGNGSEGIGISVSHSGSSLLVVVGHGEQGCDIEDIDQKSATEWLDLLGEAKFKLLEDILKINDSKNINYFGMALWSIWEVLKKSFDKTDFIFEIYKIKDSVLIFDISESEKKYFVLTIPFNLSKNSFFSLLIHKSKRENSTLFSFGYKEDLFKTDMTFSGPEGQPVYVQRFPVTFKNTQNLGKSVYFTNYFSWIGELREYSLYPIKSQLTHLLESGKWGMATNHVKLKILGVLKTDDVVETRLWVKQIMGDKNSILDLIFDWYKVLHNGEIERVAYSEQRVSWIQIIGHGLGRVEAFPKSINKFIESMKPKIKSIINEENIAYPINFNIGKKIADFSTYRVLLMDKNFETSLEESNLVGNIYFANYGKWLGKTIDLYFFNIMPELYIDSQFEKELFCTNCEIYHLNEAMPFDKIIVKMYLNKIFENGIELYFEFFKESQRLAYATYQTIYGTNKKESFISEKLPPQLLNHLKKIRDN